MQRRFPFYRVDRIDFNAVLVEEGVEDFIATVGGGEVESSVADAVGGCVDEVGDLCGVGGERGGGEEGGEEGGVVAAGGFEEEFTG